VRPAEISVNEDDSVTLRLTNYLKTLTIG